MGGWVRPVHNSPRVNVFVELSFTELVEHLLFTFPSVLLGHLFPLCHFPGSVYILFALLPHEPKGS